jgi:flagellar biosynthetic protein FliR
VTIEELIAGGVFAFLILLARVGAIVTVLPGFGDSFVTTRVRLFFVATFCLVLMPVISPLLPPPPDNPIAYAMLIGQELVIGLFIGTVARIIMSALNVAGLTISQSMSISNAFVFNPQMASQGTIVGAFLTTLAMVLIFATGLHHLMIFTAVDSYQLFPVGGISMAQDMALMIARVVSHSFTIGMQVAAPFIVISLTVYFAMGIVSRLIPQIQIFFLAIPIQIMIGLAIMAVVIGAMMMYFLSEFDAILTQMLTMGDGGSSGGNNG